MTVKVRVFQNDIYGSMIHSSKYEPDTLLETREWIDGLLAEIPEEFRATALIHVDSVGGYEGEHHAEVEVYYVRPYTAKELAQIKAEAENQKIHREREERRTLDALKKKYEAR